MGKSKEVDAWFARYDNPMKAVVHRLREIVLAADARIDECVKWQAPTFMYRGNLASFFPKSKQHASLMFHDGARIPGDHPLLEGSSEKGRVLKVGSIAEADKAKKAIEKIVKAWCAWRDEDAANTEAPAKKKVTTTKRKVAKAKTKAKDRPYSEHLADRIRAALSDRDDVVEKKMFGGIAFMVAGSMAIGILGEDLMARVGAERYEAALERPHVKVMDFTGRPLKGFVRVEAKGIATAATLKKWIAETVAYATSPEQREKQKKAAKAKRTKKKTTVLKG